MEKIKNILLWGLVAIPVVVVFKNFFDLSNPLVWGDAPFFYAENLKELFNKPFAWDVRNSNFGNSQSSILWLFIPTFLMGLMHYLFNLNHEIAVRLIFYFQCLIYSAAGVLLIQKRLAFSNLAQILGLLFYLLNTYILVVIDGGQIGVALSYGLFPLAFFTLINFADKNSIKNFVAAFIAHFFIFNTDLRIAMILVFFEVIWIRCFNYPEVKRTILKLAGISLLVLLMSGFWVIPFIQGVTGSSAGGSSLVESDLIKLTNSFYLFQPHFPNNDFGNLSKTPVYFLFLPFIFFISFLLNTKKRFVISLAGIYLMFVFLAKGSSPPFGNIYEFLITNVPLGSAFRDSSKFYIPAILIGSLLIGFSIDAIKEKIGKFKYLWIAFVYFLLIACIYPALSGNLTGVLGKGPDKNEFREIKNLILNTSGEFRTLWFGEKPSMGYADWHHPALAANLLYQERPFASMIKGEYDKFYFLHDENISKWFELVGIKYIFYPPNLREKSITPKEKAERLIFEDFISEVPNLNLVNLPVSFPVYETMNPQPKIFAQEKILFIVGGDEIYKELFKLSNFSLEKTGLVFLESCKFNPEIILNLKPEAFGLVTTGDMNDLYMSFFCNDLISPAASKTKEWSINDSSQYLNWKSQLLERGVENYDYDFSKGLAYSTNKDEKLNFELKISEEKNYYLSLRYLTASQSSGLKITFTGKEFELKSKSPDKLEWKIIGPLTLKQDNYELEVRNLGGLSAVNAISVIPQDIYEKKVVEVEDELSNAYKFSSTEDISFNEFLNTEHFPIDQWQVNPTEYKVKVPKGANWLVFSERFDSNWKFKNDEVNKNPLPFYALLNGYYISEIPEGTYTVYYDPQKTIGWGLFVTFMTFSLVCIAALLHIILKGKPYGSSKKYFRNTKN